MADLAAALRRQARGPRRAAHPACPGPLRVVLPIDRPHGPPFFKLADRLVSAMGQRAWSDALAHEVAHGGLRLRRAAAHALNLDIPGEAALLRDSDQYVRQAQVGRRLTQAHPLWHCA